MEDKNKHIPKSLLPFVSVAATAGFLYDLFSKVFSFMELLSSEGTDAFRTFIRPAILALLALIMSIAYISSTKKQPAKTQTGDVTDGKAHDGKPSVFEVIAKTIIKFCIGLLIAGIIACSVWGYFVYKEYSQRPKVEVINYLDLKPAINGYEGEATFDKDEVENNLPRALEDIYTEFSYKYDHNADNSDRENAWYEFISNLSINYEGKTSGLNNDDKITVTIEYLGKNLSQIKSDTHLKIEGLGEPCSLTISEIKKLPHRFADAAQAKFEKGDVITDVENYLKNSIADDEPSDIECRSFLCKPKYSDSTEPDALAVVVRYTRFKGRPSESVVYDACYLYPFDSRASSDMITENIEGFRFREDFTSNDEKALENDIRRGDRFNSNAEYNIEPIN